MSNGRPPRQPSSPTNGLEDEESGNVMYQSGNNAAEEIHSQTFRSPELRSILSVPSFRASAIRQLSRSHYSSRSDSESGSEILGSIPTRSAQEIRQQTMSYTFRDLSMSQSSRLGNPISDDKSSISSPVIAVDFLSSNDQPEQNTSLEIQKNPIDPTTFGLSVPHGRNVSQLSELRRAMSTSSSSNSPPHPEQTAALNSDHTTGDTITDSSQSNSHSNKSHASSSAFHMKLNDVRFPDEDDTDTEETTMLLKGYREDLSGDELQVTTGYDRVGNSVTWYGSVDVDRNRKQAPTTFRSILKHTQRDIPTITPALLLEIGANGLRSIPAVILGLILNILDAMSYGIIVFPQSDPLMPSSATQSGISMFFASTVIAQLVYTFGGSKFKGANGSMMIEVMPFLHIMCRIIEEKVGGNNQKTLMATIMVAYSLSTLMTGLVFLLLGVFKLGNVIQFFPRHILVGCIGGIGLFLIETGIEVSTGLKTEFTFEYLKQIFSLQYLPLWGSGALLAVFLKIMQRYISHPLFVPSFYVIVPLFFYAVVWFIGVSLDDLRKNGWLFDLPSSSEVPYYTFWTYFDFNHVDWSAIPATLPTILALTFFGILHVPINVPALAVSTQQEVDTNLEIVGHGISNIAAGLIGTVQNYLVYANSLLYIRSGGNTRIGGFLLAIATAVVWIVGGSVVSLVPTMVVGSLIFLLGIDLMKESIVDTLHVGIHFLEYLTILVIIAIMGIFGFTEGILAGIVLACFFFVIIYSRRSVIRTSYSGTNLRSTVHRLYRQQRFLDQCGNQIQIIKLQGFMFFGTINQLDVTIQELLHGSEKVRFVVLDFSLISGIDYSAVEAFLRIKRKLMEQNIHFVFSGLGDVTADLVKSGIFDTTSDTSTLVHNFEDLNGALEWCENVLLATYFKQRSRQSIGPQIPQVPHGVLETGTREIQIGKHDPEPSPSLSIFTPRERDVYQAAYFALEGNKSPLPTSQYHPVHVLMNAVSESGHIDPELEYVFAMFERVELVPHHLIWSPGESANELFVVDTGELILYSEGEDGSPDRVIETLLGGTMVGELEMFSNRPRTSRLRSGPHGHAVVWRLSLRSFEELERTHPKLAMKFVRLALEFDSERLYNVVQHATALWGIQTEIVQSKTASHKMRSQQELQKLTVADLKAVQTGVKADLIKRILEHEAKQQTTATASKPAPPEITTTTAPSNGSTLAKAVSQPANSNLTVDGSAGTPANTPIVTTAPDMPAENKVNDDSAMKKARAERFGVPFVDPDEQAEKRKLREMKFGISSKETLQEQEEAAKKRRIEKFGLTSPTLEQQKIEERKKRFQLTTSKEEEELREKRKARFNQSK